MGRVEAAAEEVRRQAHEHPCSDPQNPMKTVNRLEVVFVRPSDGARLTHSSPNAEPPLAAIARTYDSGSQPDAFTSRGRKRGVDGGIYGGSYSDSQST